MKFSAQEEYGLRCLITIGLKESATIPEISREEGLSEHHTAKLLSILRKAGFINSTRGHIGGYRLARPAEEIAISSVLEVLGGKLYDKRFCAKHSGLLTMCTHVGSCSIRSIWRQIQDSVDNVLDRVSLADLLAEAEVAILELPKERTGLKNQELRQVTHVH